MTLTEREFAEFHAAIGERATAHEHMASMFAASGFNARAAEHAETATKLRYGLRLFAAYVRAGAPPLAISSGLPVPPPHIISEGAR